MINVNAHTDARFAKSFKQAVTLHWEADFFCKGQRAGDKRAAKRIMRKARRRLERRLCAAY